MSKYRPLQEYLAGRGGPELQLSFGDVERIVGGILPRSAARRQWWANESDPFSSHVQCRAWREAGYDAFPRVSKRLVRFRRHPAVD
jgi:hypothetical protein